MSYHSLPVRAGVHRAPSLLGEDNAVVLPEVRRRVAFQFLDLPVSDEDRRELGRQWNGLAATFLDLPEDQAAA
jgi:hypothetical protein